jgi:hypothetical protein
MLQPIRGLVSFNDFNQGTSRAQTAGHSVAPKAGYDPAAIEMRVAPNDWA